MIIHMRCGECEHYTGGICTRANPSCIVKETFSFFEKVIIAIMILIVATILMLFVAGLILPILLA